MTDFVVSFLVIGIPPYLPASCVVIFKRNNVSKKNEHTFLTTLNISDCPRICILFSIFHIEMQLAFHEGYQYCM